MDWVAPLIAAISKQPVCDYTTAAAGASEPSALAALALIGHGHASEAAPVGEFLASLQTVKGCIGMRAKDSEPHWPTSLAMIVWQLLDPDRYAANLKSAVAWSLSIYGERIPRKPDLGHNSELAAWPWVEGTHSWLEPSALFTIALKVLGLRKSPRTEEAVQLLWDRLLPQGGCNYGNTVVLGQTLRPHLQPSGIVALALHGESSTDARLTKTLDYLADSCRRDTTPNSLAWALLGLAAHGRSPANALSLLEQAYSESMKRAASPYTLALLANAVLLDRSPLVSAQRESL